MISVHSVVQIIFYELIGQSGSFTVKHLVLGVGNVLLSDDGVGPYVVRRAETLLSDLKGQVDFKENYSGGFDLLYDIEGYDRVILVDCITTGNFEPGTCITCEIADVDTTGQQRLVDAHGVNLPTVLATGHRCGYKMPEELLIFGIESEDVTTFSENLTDKVAAHTDYVVKRIQKTLQNWLEQEGMVTDKKV